MKAASRRTDLCRARIGAWAKTGAALLLAAWAVPAADLSLDNIAGGPGALVVVRVSVDQALGIAGGRFVLDLPEFATGGEPIVTPDTSGFLLASRTGSGRLTVTMARATGLPEGPAVLFTLPIRIRQDAPEGAFTLAWREAQLLDEQTALVETRAIAACLTVLPPPEDRDDDGLPDEWETQHFGRLTGAGTDDPDGDGASNDDEYLAGTDPASAESVFRVNALAVLGLEGEPLITLDWEGQPGREYQVYWSAGPLGPSTPWSPVYHPVYQMDGSRYRWTDDGTRTYRAPLADIERYYQVRVRTP